MKMEPIDAAEKLTLYSSRKVLTSLLAAGEAKQVARRMGRSSKATAFMFNTMLMQFTVHHLTR